ncbi:Inositol monophosphatase 3 [Bonamia ostreae]|uniref:3'(2'),5'-bisphosphate nucleotidase n=1 Tax=Bonamia ostreae TaxID=126728 RepID=A0ABV2AST4_9EUKA
MELLQPKNIKLSNLLSVCIFSAEKAGKEIIKIHKNGFKTFDKSFNQNFGRRVKSFDPCTEADIKSQEIIESALKTEFPGIFIIGEEKTSSAKKVAEKSNFGNISFKNSENFDVTLLLKDIIVWIGFYSN